MSPEILDWAVMECVFLMHLAIALREITLFLLRQIANLSEKGKNSPEFKLLLFYQYCNEKLIETEKTKQK